MPEKISFKQRIKNTINKYRFILRRKYIDIKFKPKNIVQSNSHVTLNIRKYGFYFNKNFSKENSIAGDILKKYQSISEDKIINFINEKKSKRDIKSKYKLSSPHFIGEDLLYKYASDPFFKENITEYFGFEPDIYQISFWLDFYDTQIREPLETQFFHRDGEDVKLIKTFLYLNDVSENNGPFEYISTSHLTPWKNLKPRNTLDDIKNIYDNRVDLKTFVGNAGSLIISDTNGFHRGKKVNEKYRALVTVTYCSKKPKIKKAKELISMTDLPKKFENYQNI